MPSVRRSSPVLHTILCAVAAVVTIAAGAADGVRTILRTLPPLNPALLQFEQSMHIQDRTGGALYRTHDGEDRTTIAGDDISPLLKNAMVAAEDERFFTRTLCVDVIGILRAVRVNLRTGGRTQGGSTITQQLVRAAYLTPEKTYERKIAEIILSCMLERRLSREAILTAYVNVAPFGGTVYGAEQAARSYFGVSADRLTLAQAAVLAAIPQRPSVYAQPSGRRTVVDHDIVRAVRRGTTDIAALDEDAVRQGLIGRQVRTPDGTVWLDGRAEVILRIMRKNGMITEAAEAAARRDLRGLLLKAPVSRLTAAHFVEWIRRDMRALLTTLDHPEAWRRSGMHVHTTLDPALQQLAETTLQEAKNRLSAAGARHAALVAIDRATRDVVAYAGNIDYFDPDGGAVDMARTPRQTGSAFKPVVYTASLARTGAHSGTLILDAPLPLVGNPKNYDGTFHGWMKIRTALGGSRNLPAIRAFFDAGGEYAVLQTASAMGAPTPQEFLNERRATDPGYAYGWPAALGSAELPLIELAHVYATIADGGRYLPLRTVNRIEASDGTLLLDIPRLPPVQAVDERAAREVDEILRSAEDRPRGFWRDALTVPGKNAGVKTGTSNICLLRTQSGTCASYGVNNVWTVGYDDTLVVGVWVGNADAAPLSPVADGLTLAAPLWRSFLEKASAMGQ